MPDVSPIQLAIVLIIALVILGPKRLPDVGKSLGRGIREFKDSVSGNDVPRPLPTEPVTTEPVATRCPADRGAHRRAAPGCGRRRRPRRRLDDRDAVAMRVRRALAG